MTGPAAPRDRRVRRAGLRRDAAIQFRHCRKTPAKIKDPAVVCDGMTFREEALALGQAILSHLGRAGDTLLPDRPEPRDRRGLGRLQIGEDIGHVPRRDIEMPSDIKKGHQPALWHRPHDLDDVPLYAREEGRSGHTDSV